MKLLSGTSNPALATSIAKSLQIEQVEVEITTFANGEKRVWITDSVKGQNIILVQSFSNPANDNIIEFLLLVDSLQRMGARNVNLVLPWMGYSLQDKVFREGEPIAARVVADLVSQTYIKRAFLLDLHNSSTPGFFSLPTQHLSALELFVTECQKTFNLADSIVASPDFGGIKRARVFAEQLGLELVNIDKHRNLQTGEASVLGLSGDVQGKTVLLFDDVINTGSTVVNVAAYLKAQGAKSVHFLATHGIFADNGVDRIENSEIDSVVVSNSIPQTTKSAKIRTIDCAPLFADAVSTWA